METEPILDQILENCDDPVILRNLLHDTRKSLRDVTRELAEAVAAKEPALTAVLDITQALTVANGQRDKLLAAAKQVSQWMKDDADECEDLWAIGELRTAIADCEKGASQ